LLHPLLLHVALGGIGADESSDSDSGGGAGDLVGVGAAIAARGLDGSSVDSEPFVVTAMGFGAAGAGRLSTDGGDTGAGVGVSSTVECLPVVHGGIERNSSKVRTRGLQHFQPVVLSQSMFSISRSWTICQTARTLEWEESVLVTFVPRLAVYEE
jgi:hypothetical protein